jgi:carboxylesterase
VEYIKGSEPFSFSSSSEKGILVIHGFTGTASSVYSLTDAFSKSGYNVECPRLTGHGTSWQDLEKTKYEDWINDVEKSFDVLKKRSSKIYVAGLSMGGSLALYLAEKHPEILKVIVVNNALIFNDIRIKLIPVFKYLVRTAPGVGSDLKDSSKKEICYDTVPSRGVHEMVKLLDIVKKNLGKIQQPVLIFKSKEDHVIPLESATYVYENISSAIKELVWLENSYHVATMDNDMELVCRKSIEFLNQ